MRTPKVGDIYRSTVFHRWYAMTLIGYDENTRNFLLMWSDGGESWICMKNMETLVNDRYFELFAGFT